MKWGFIPHHFIGDVMDGHGIKGYRHAGIEQFVDRDVSFSFEGDLAQAIDGTGSGGFGIEKEKHIVFSSNILTILFYYLIQDFAIVIYSIIFIISFRVQNNIGGI